jgi:hypothetical protein
MVFVKDMLCCASSSHGVLSGRRVATLDYSLCNLNVVRQGICCMSGIPPSELMEITTAYELQE